MGKKTKSKGKKKRGKKSPRHSVENESTPPPLFEPPQPPAEQLQPCRLRFLVGDDVIFCSNGKNWSGGTIQETNYRSSKWPDSRPSIAYRVEQKSPNQEPGTVEIEHDTEDCIRVLPPLRYPRELVSKLSVQPPEPNDPMSHLYLHGPLKNRFLETLDALDEFKGEDQIVLYETHDDGSSTVCRASEVASRNRETFRMPLFDTSSLIHGVPPLVVMGYIVPRVRWRTQFQEHTLPSKAILESILPEASSIKALESRIESSPLEQRGALLLQLGDSLAFGLNGWPRNIFRATTCYQACSEGVSMLDVMKKRRGPPAAGLPEGTCALATVSHYQAELFAHAWKHHLAQPQGGAGMERPELDIEDIVLASQHQPTVLEYLSQMLPLLKAALRHGFVSVLAIQYGKYFDESPRQKFEWLMPSNEHAIERIRQAYVNQQLIHGLQKDMRSEGRTCPNESTLEKFRPKAVDILRKISPSATEMELHVRLVELDTVSKSTCVVLVNPAANGFVDSFVLPKALQLFPCADETFEWIWCRIAFTIHLGIKETKHGIKQRVRPNRIMLSRSPSDRNFARFLETRCQSIPGTSAVVIEEKLEERWQVVSAVTQERLKQRRNNPIASSSSFWCKVVQTKPLALDGNVKEEVESLQDKGIAFLEKRKFSAARGAFIDAIATVRYHIRQPPPTILELLGSLLHNFAACCMEMARTEEPWRGAAVLREGILCYELILSSKSICFAMSDRMIRLARSQRDLAQTRIPLDFDLLAHPEHLVSVSEFPPSLDLNFKLELFKQSSSSHFENRQPDVMDVSRVHTVTNEKDCPVCLRSYTRDMSKESIVVLLGCGHVYCIHCVLRIIESCKDPDVFNCPICRETSRADVVGLAMDRVLSWNAKLKEVTKELPGKTEDARHQILRQLLEIEKFDVNATMVRVVELLCNGSFYTAMRKREDLTSEQKEEIFSEARRPVWALQRALTSSEKQLNDMPNAESDAYSDLKNRIGELRVQLRDAWLNAREEIYSRMNSAGVMGKMNANMEYTLDFHGLTVQEAFEKFDNEIMQFLPVLKKIVLVTGYGRHSKSGHGAIKPALKSHVARCHSGEAELEDCTRNRGAMFVHSIPRNSNR